MPRSAELPKQSQAFASLVRSALEREALSLQEAARRTPGTVSFGTWRTMAMGFVASPVLIVPAARAVGDDPNDWLAAAGFPWLRYDRERDPEGGTAGRVKTWGYGCVGSAA